VTNTEIVPACTHIAAVTWWCREYRVIAVYPRHTEGLRERHPGASWIFVPANVVQPGDGILPTEGLTSYADPIYAERYAAGAEEE
jgi:hypothetical protein